MTDIQVGSVTIGDITDALDSGDDEVDIVVLYQKIIKLHYTKCGVSNLKSFLDDIANTCAKIKIYENNGTLTSNWLSKLYDMVIALTLSQTLKKSDDIDSELIEKINKIAVSSWNKMVAALPE